MGKNREQSFGFNVFQNVIKAVRSREIGCFHQKTVMIGSDSQQVSRFETLLKKVVNHVLSAKMKSQTSLVVLLKVLEAGAEIISLVRYILHDVRCKPHCLHA